jgi:hypothetical protein
LNEILFLRKKEGKGKMTLSKKKIKDLEKVYESWKEGDPPR